MTVWYPLAQIVTGNHSGDFIAGYTKKGVLHTTEGSSASGAISAYRAANSWPHFTIDRQGKVYQHVAIDKAARALKNLSGGVETNRGGAIQIEVTGFASEAGGWPQAEIDGLKKLMRWIEAEAGVKPLSPGRVFASAYGQKWLRFSNQEWISFAGWCGHCHVPENDHWDPGAISLSTLLPTPIPTPYVIVVKTEEVDMQVSYVNVKIPTDGNGNGNWPVPYLIDNILGVLPPGIRPNVDGRYESCEVGFAQEDPNTIVSVVGWAPNAEALVRIRVSV